MSYFEKGQQKMVLLLSTVAAIRDVGDDIITCIIQIVAPVKIRIRISKNATTLVLVQRCFLQVRTNRIAFYNFTTNRYIEITKS
jgi:hypothetical protein